MRNQRAARSALLYGVGGFITLQLLLVLLLGLVAPGLRDPMHGAKAQGLERRLASAPRDARTVVMLGSSRTAYGIDADTVARILSSEQGREVVAYNFGLLGAGPCTTLLSLRRLLDTGARPDLLLIEIVPYLLGGDGLPVDLSERYLPTASLRLDELPLVQRLAGEQRSVSRLDWWLSWLVPCHRHRFTLVSHTMPTLLHYLDRSNNFRAIDRGGWLPMSGHTSADLAVVRRGIEPHLNDFRPGGPSCEALEETLRLCREQSISVALVLMPEGPAFRSWYPPRVLKQVHGLLDDLSRRYDAPVIDARDWIEECGFLDSHHLLCAAAKRFSERLARQELQKVAGCQGGGSSRIAGRCR